MPLPATEPRLRRVSWGRRRCPLKKPYELSFVTLTDFDAVWVRIEDADGAVGLGESVALPGYGWETADDVEGTVRELLDGAEGRPSGELVARCRKRAAKSPFAASAIMTAIDLPALIGGRQAGFSFPLNVAVAGDADPDLLRGQVERHLAAGRKYVKAKVGRNLAAECAAATILLAGEFAHPFKVVFDANQAYSPEDAMHFSDALAALPRDRLLWLEQPVDRADWDAMSRVCAHARIPIVLDEAIYDETDIRKAAAMSAFGVKLKLVKNFGPRRTLELARFARDLGLDVVFGNGVATDIGNFAEALTLATGRGLFSAPCECSGFQKLVRPLLPGLIAENDLGEIVLTHEGPLAETTPLDEMLP